MAAFFLVAVFVLSAGFAKIMAMCVNWICAQRLAKKLVFADKTLNLVLIAAYPLLLVIGLGFRGPRLLAGGRSLDLPIGWWLPIAAGIVGFVVLVRSTVVYWRYRPPACEIAVESQLVDLRLRFRDSGRSWRDVLVGPGPMRRIALLPGNEQFTIEVSTKTYALPRLPAAWNGLSLVHLSDCHFRGGVTRAFFEAVCDEAAALKPDLFVFTGDLLDDQRLLDWLPETLGRLTAPWGRYFILGNHDWYLDSEVIRREFTGLGWIDLGGNCVSLPVPSPPSSGERVRVRGSSSEKEATSAECHVLEEGLNSVSAISHQLSALSPAPPLILCGDETPWMGTHPELSPAPADAFRILLSHTPDNITWARHHGIDVMLSGHTHGGQIRLPILGPVYSPSRFDCRFASGVFWLDPTLLYVSRGLSGKEPIRYNCLPEVTKLVLKSTTG